MTEHSEKFEKMRIAGKLAAQTLDMLTENIKPGVTTEFIDKLGYEFIRDNGGYSAPLFYRGFKKSLCTSLNHVVCHGIPSDRVLVEGDALLSSIFGGLFIVSAIASPEALEYLKKYLPESTQYFVGAIDQELTAQAYIVPGMGDAGDLAFGIKC